MLLGAMIALSGACAEDAGDSEVESMTEGMRGLGDKSDMKKSGRYIEKLGARLDLSEEQMARLEKELQRGISHEEKAKVLEGILTPEQFAKYQERKDRRSSRDKHGPKGRRGIRSPEKHAAWLQKELDLTDEVTARVETVFKETTGREEKQEALGSILSPEQFEQFEEMVANRGRWHKKHGFKSGFKAPGKHAFWLKEELELTDEQVARVEAALAETTSREEMHEAIKGILTPEQLTLHEELMAERHSCFGKRGKHHERGDGPPSGM